MKAHNSAWILAAIHLALAAAYAFVTPYREGGRLFHQGGAYAADVGAPDERQHANYVGRVAEGQGLPVFDPEAPNLYETYQSHQPPLYYLLAAPVAMAAGQVEHLATGRALRLLNCLIGAVGVLGVYFFAYWGFRSRGAALAAGAFASLLPMHLALSGAVSNDPLLFALCSWTMAVAALACRQGWTLPRGLAVGLLMGLAFLTKTTSVALWPAVALGYLLSRKIPREAATTPWAGAAALLLPLAFGAPWWLRNMSLYGDPFAMKAFTQAFTGSPQAQDFLRAFGPADYWLMGGESGTGVFWWTLRSFFGAFGYMDVFLSPGLYWSLAAATVGLALAALVKQGPKAQEEDEERPGRKAVTIMGSVFLLLVLALFLRFNAQYFQGQARYLFPAIAPIAAAIGLGAFRLVGRRAAWVVGAVLLALNAYILSLLPAEFEKRLAQPPLAREGSEEEPEPLAMR
jgi:4-amino-4-deoxy-L-arabinose transferase-like glycosyltransferase